MPNGIAQPYCLPANISPGVGLPPALTHEVNEAVQFYNLKTKQAVDVSESDIKKRRSVRTTSGGKTQERYAVVAEVSGDGRPLQMFKFVNKATFDSLTVPEIS